MLSKREMLKIVGITAVLLSVVYYTIIISFISHGEKLKNTLGRSSKIFSNFRDVLFYNKFFHNAFY